MASERGDAPVDERLDAERRIEALLGEEYRVACPRGHVSLDPAATTPTVYCRSCGRAYRYEELQDRG